jgi:copper homeostasis protein
MVSLLIPAGRRVRNVVFVLVQPTRTTQLEICLEEPPGAVIAEANGADRVELCTNLAVGGITPRMDAVRTVLDSVTTVGVQVLIRPRPGDFVFDRAEVAGMVRDIEAIGALPRPARVRVGFVIGALTAEGQVDTGALTRLLAACGSAPVTFHRAFDAIADQSTALEVLVDHGLHRVLTAGGPGTAEAGTANLATLVEQAQSRITVLAAGSIRAHNVAEIVRRTGVREVHLRADQSPDSALTSGSVVRAVASQLQSHRNLPARPV